jgi:hypothetical protein
VDPILISTVAAQLLQQQQLIISLAARAAQEEEERRALLEEREKLLESARQEAEELVHQASSQPQRTYVRLQIMLSSLVAGEVVPDSYADQKTKEQVVLLWRRLSHLDEKSRSLMTEEQLAQCMECLNALYTEYWIRETAIRLEAYEEYQRLKTQWESAQRKIEQITLLRRWLWAAIVGISLVSFLAYARSAGFDQAANYLILWVLGTGGLAGLVLPVTDSLLPKDRKTIEHDFQAAGQNAEIANTEFWEKVAEMFDGVPRMEQLEQMWTEQEAIIAALFAEEPNGESKAEL